LKDKIKMFTHIKDIQLLSSEKCSWLHNHLNSLPLVKFPFDVKSLPSSGVYFVYEEGEITEHGYGISQRIVRIGTHMENNFQARISEYFLLNGSKLNFTIANQNHQIEAFLEKYRKSSTEQK
jgi:hypothetical protein